MLVSMQVRALTSSAGAVTRNTESARSVRSALAGDSYIDLGGFLGDIVWTSTRTVRRSSTPERRPTSSAGVRRQCGNEAGVLPEFEQIRTGCPTWMRRLVLLRTVYHQKGCLGSSAEYSMP